MCLSLTALLIKVGRFHLVHKSPLAKIPLFLQAKQQNLWSEKPYFYMCSLSLACHSPYMATRFLGYSSHQQVNNMSPYMLGEDPRRICWPILLLEKC